MKKLLTILMAILLLSGCSKPKEAVLEPIGYSQPYYVLAKTDADSDLTKLKIAYPTAESCKPEELADVKQQLIDQGVPEENFVEVYDYRTIIAAIDEKDFDAWITSESANELVKDYYPQYIKYQTQKLFETKVAYYEEKTIDPSITEDELFTKPFMVMLTGIDERTDPSNNKKARNDVNHLMVVDPVLKHVTTISFPRDTYLYVPSKGYSAKLCEIGVYSGNEGIREAIANVLGLESIDNYVQVSFSSFIDAITDFGGVRVDVPLAMHMDQDSYRNVANPTTLEKGNFNLIGEYALALARNRKYDGIYNGDYGRIRNQVLLINGLIEKIAKNTEVLRWVGITWRAKFLSYTNFTDEQMEVLMNLADTFAQGYTIDNWFIHNGGGTAPNGAWIGIIQPATLEVAKGKLQLALTGEIAEDNPYYADIMEGYVSKGASTTGYEGYTYDLKEVYK